jgi:hypothetical protein
VDLAVLDIQKDLALVFQRALEHQVGPVVLEILQLQEYY